MLAACVKCVMQLCFTYKRYNHNIQSLFPYRPYTVFHPIARPVRQVVLFSLDARARSARARTGQHPNSGVDNQDIQSTILNRAKKGDVIVCHVTKDTVKVGT